jgi:hypothetical protein
MSSSTLLSHWLDSGTLLYPKRSYFPFSVSSGTMYTPVYINPYSVNQSLYLKGRINNGASAIAMYIDSDQALTTAGAKILSIRNAGVEKNFFDKDGNLMNVKGNVQTTNATQTTLITLSLTDNRVYFVECVVLGNKSDNTQRAVYQRTVAVYRANGGVATILNSVVSLLTAESDASWDCTFDVSNNEVRVRVTGAAATTINWEGHLRYDVM